MIAPLLIALAAAPLLIALWALAWLIADLFDGPASVPVRVRANRRQ